MSQLEELKSLLFSKEQESLDELQNRVANRGIRAQDVADVLPESIAMHAGDQARLVESLRLPVGECIRQSVKQDTDLYADALSPVIGPAIRRAVADSFKSAMQRLNQTLEQGLSLQGLKWRFESRRTGIPVSELILRDTLVYSIEQLFLIHRETGLLIEHVAVDRPESADSDAVSAMLTAIQAFVHDSFGGKDGDDGDLDTIDIGGHLVWLFYGPDAMLACVLRGIAPLSMRGRYEALLDDIHRQYANELAQFDGAPGALPGAGALMAEQLHIETEQVEDERGGKSLLSPPLVAVLALLLAGAAFLVYQGYREQRQLAVFTGSLAQTPGLLVTDVGREDATITVTGLKDPLAADPRPLAAAAGYESGDVRFTLHPYQSLEPAFVLERARRLLAPPPGVELALADGRLTVTGSADTDWIDRTALLPLTAIGVASVDRSGLAPAALAPPPGVELSLADDRLRVSGVAPLAAAERIELDRQVAALGRTAIEFSVGATLSENGSARLGALVERLRAASALADTVG
ncbi:MAG: hypothetical protein HKO62_04580, partial [Gammaproteobacteria bacterium]|nr:hypothetical protein [Gammaproteobacteria bacterium]